MIKVFDGLLPISSDEVIRLVADMIAMPASNPMRVRMHSVDRVDIVTRRLDLLCYLILAQRIDGTRLEIWYPNEEPFPVFGGTEFDGAEWVPSGESLATAIADVLQKHCFGEQLGKSVPENERGCIPGDVPEDEREKWETVLSMRKRGKTYEQMAFDAAISTSTLSRMLDKMGMVKKRGKT